MLIIIAFASECNIRSLNGCCVSVCKWLYSYDSTYRYIILTTRIIALSRRIRTRTHVVYRIIVRVKLVSCYANGEKDNEDIKPIQLYTTYCSRHLTTESRIRRELLPYIIIIIIVRSKLMRFRISNIISRALAHCLLAWFTDVFFQI